jgi:hypothetical protein
MLHKHIQRLVRYRLNINSLDFTEKVYILTFDELSGVCKYLTIYLLDQLQLEAAIIGSGLPIFASSILIYKELGWESLVERRQRRKLQMFYNIQNNNPPM